MWSLPGRTVVSISSLEASAFCALLPLPLLHNILLVGIMVDFAPLTK